MGTSDAPCFSHLSRHSVHNGLLQHGVGGVERPSKHTRHGSFNGGGLMHSLIDGSWGISKRKRVDSCAAVEVG